MRYTEAILAFSCLAIPLILFESHFQFLIAINRHTCGKDGIWYKAHNSQWYYEPALTVPLVGSVTGAGEAFLIGFLSHFIRKKPIKSCIDYAFMIIQKIGRANALYKTQPIAQ